VVKEGSRMIRQTIEVTMVLSLVSSGTRLETRVYVHRPDAKNAYQSNLLLVGHLQLQNRGYGKCAKENICDNSDDSLSNVDTTAVDAYRSNKEQRVPACSYGFTGEQQAEKDRYVSAKSHTQCKPDERLEQLFEI
jgi:hypothetical protein